MKELTALDGLRIIPTQFSATEPLAKLVVGGKRAAICYDFCRGARTGAGRRSRPLGPVACASGPKSNGLERQHGGRHRYWGGFHSQPGFTIQEDGRSPSLIMLLPSNASLRCAKSLISNGDRRPRSIVVEHTTNRRGAAMAAFAKSWRRE
jgi:hypothetical protein